MSKTFLLKFTPQDAYFFGNEKTFVAKDWTNNSGFNNKYYIKSEKLPSQSTMLGAVRYLMIPDKKSDFSYNHGDLDEIIGPESFNPEKNEQTFGVIEGISPIYLYNNQSNVFLIPTPLVHSVKRENPEKDENGNTVKPKRIKNEVYSPFQEYKTYKTSKSDKEHYYADDFETKDGTAESFVALDGNNTIYSYDDLFTTTMRVGIDRNKKDDAFFKKDYVILKNDYCFAIYLTLKDSAKNPENSVIYLGQNKSAFTVTVESVDENHEKNTTDKITALLNQTAAPEGCEVYYCQSDVFAPKDVFNESYFSVIKTKTYRSFTTIKGVVKKGDMLYNLIAAGSVFMIPNGKDVAIANKTGISKAGYNKILISDKSQSKKENE